jgi:hypothetical protein
VVYLLVRLILYKPRRGTLDLLLLEYLRVLAL